MYEWSAEKDRLLQEERGVGFEDVVIAIDSGGLLAVKEHPNKERYPNQMLYVVRMKGYAYLVPFVREGERIFLKTIIPSRKANREFQGDEHA